MKNFFEYYRFRIGKSGEMPLYCNERMDSMFLRRRFTIKRRREVETMKKKHILASWMAVALFGAGIGVNAAEDARQLQEEQLFRTTTGQVDLGGSCLYYSDMHELGAKAESMGEFICMALADSDESSQEALHAARIIFETLNLKALQAMAYSSRSVDGVVVNKSYTLFNQADPKGLLFSLSPWENRPLTGRSMILPGARLALGGYLQPAVLWKEFSNLAVKMPMAEARDLPAQADAMVLAGAGVPLDDLLATLEGEYFLMVTEELQMNGDLQIPDFQIMVILPDRNGVLRQLIEKKGEGFLQKSPDGYKVMMPMAPGMSPEIILEEGRVVLVSSRKIWDAAKAGAKMENHPEFGAYFRDMPADGQAFAYVNISETLAGFVSAALDNHVDFEELLGGKLPVVYAVSRSEGNGKQLVCRSNYSINELQTTIPLTIYSGILLPALNQARERARSISCVSNLKQIGLGLMMYASDNGDQFPAEPGEAGLSKLLEAGYLPGTVFICPSSESAEATSGEQLDDESCSYIYCGNLIATPDAPLVLEKPGNHPTGGCNVLFADGHVETLYIGGSDYPAEVVKYLAERNELAPETTQQLLDTLKKLGYEPLPEVEEMEFDEVVAE